MAGIDEGVVQVRADDEDEFTEDAVEALKSRVTRKKGRGFGDVGTGYQGQYESIHDADDTQGPMRSVEGWIIFVSNIHEEAQEDDIHDFFSEYGEIKNIHLNLDRRTGFLKGYALVEYETFKEANSAVEKLNGTDFLGQKVIVDWAFVKPKEKGARRSRRQ